MKTFKQFINETKKEPVLIVNTHGSHAKKKEPILIVNTHGSHAQKKNSNPYVKESEENNSEETWESFKSKNHNPGVTRTNNYQEQMDWLNKTHPLNPESHDHIRKWTSDSSMLSDHFLDRHKRGIEPEPIVWGHDVAGLDNAITSHHLKHKLTTFTGTGFNPEKLDSNKVVTHLSSSIDPHTARSFSKPDTDVNPGKKTYHIIKHNLPKGMSAAIIGRHEHNRDRKPISVFPAENEVLLPRTDATKEKHELHFNGYKDYPDKDGNIIRVHNGEWKPTA